jgi:hypothetical protein
MLWVATCFKFVLWTGFLFLRFVFIGALALPFRVEIWDSEVEGNIIAF